MFGYVLPDVLNLKVYEEKIYRATYCGLCKQIKKRFGGFYCLQLSYDITFLALFLICYLKDKPIFEKKICKMHPFKKKLVVKENPSLKKAADVGLILFYFKLKDNISDCKFFKKVFFYFLLLLFKRPYKKAKKSEEEVAEFAKTLIKEQTISEKEKNMPLDYYAHPTSKCVGNIFKSFSKEKEEKENLYRMGYMLGKYTYLMDALDDLKKDLKTKNFNPILQEKEIKTAVKKTEELINFSIAQMAESFEKLKIKKEANILKNVIYLGLKATKKNILKKNKNLFS